MTARIRRLSLRYRLTLAALAVEAVMLGFLIANGVQLTTAAPQQQAQFRLDEVGKTLEAALLAPLMQQDDASVREIVDSLRREDGLERIEVRDSAGRPVHVSGGTSHSNVFITRRAVRLAGSTYGEVSLVLSGDFIAEARARYLQQSLLLAAAALLLTGILLAFATGRLVRRFEALTAASTRMEAGDLNVRLSGAGEDEIGQLIGTFNRMAQSVRESIARARDDEARFHAIADYTHDLEFWLSPDGRLRWVNPSVERMLGYRPDECTAQRYFPLDFIHPDDRASAKRQLQAALLGSSGAGYTMRLQRKDGSQFWAMTNWQPIHDPEGHYQGIRASIHNIDDLKATEASLRRAVDELRTAESLQRRYLEETEAERARLVALLSAMNLGILFVAADGHILYHNPTFKHIWLIEPATPLVGQPVDAVLANAASALARPDHFSRHLAALLEARAPTDSYEIEMSDGRIVTELDYPVHDREGRFIGHLWIYEDITRERQTAEQLSYLAERDPLTGLYNRHRFQQELVRTLAETDRQRTQCAVMFFDLDEFKAINDTYGHRAGDALLIRVAGEIGALVRRNEVLARLGGDEFAILLPAIDEAEVEMLAARLVRAIAQIPFRFEGHDLRLTSSLGVAYYPRQAVDADELVARADIAMYQAKDAGKNTWRVFRVDSSADSEMRNRLSMGERVSNALDHDLFELHFQGVYRAADGALSHLEALIRMIDPAAPDTLIMPAQFIPLAEKSGRILDVDRWAIRQVVARLASDTRLPPIAVNLSGRSLSEPSLPQTIANVLREAGVRPERLIVEITETAAVSDLHDAQRLIDALRTLGCGVCLDDFGVGFASFAYLKHLQADTIKIDGIFIRDLADDADNQVFVRAMVGVARGLGMRVVAEYVEDERTLTLLRAFGVDLVQGYHLDHPVRCHPALVSAALVRPRASAPLSA